MIRALCITLLLSLCACSMHRASVANSAKDDLVGMSKAELLACAGAPARQDQADDIEVLTYVAHTGSTGSSYTQATATSDDSASAVSTNQTKERYCEATFTLRDGAIERVSYSGKTGGVLTKGQSCYYIIENCVD